MIQCTNCGNSYPQEGLPYICPTCRGIFDFRELPQFDRELIDQNQPGIWKYQHTFGLPESAPSITLGEGNTPLVWSQVNGHEVGFKIEYQNPTSSFKDRGAALLVSFLKSRDIKQIAEDSSGNAGASIAAYAARAGISAQLFIPDATRGPKRKQIEEYGAKVTKVLGPRSNTAEVVRIQAESGKAYASHVYLPFHVRGYSTISYELFEHLGDAPGSVIMPTGQGGLLLGVGRGFETLNKSQEIKHMPRLIGVQAQACAPLWAVFEYGQSGLMWVAEGDTIAEGIRVRNPIRGDSVLEMVRKSEGLLLAVDEEDIRNGQTSLGRIGFYVEPTTAVVWKPLWDLVAELPKPVIVILTGSGLKS